MTNRTIAKLTLLILFPVVIGSSLTSVWDHNHPVIKEVSVSSPAASDADVGAIISNAQLTPKLDSVNFQLKKAILLANTELNNDSMHFIELDGSTNTGDIKLICTVEYDKTTIPTYNGCTYVQ